MGGFNLVYHLNIIARRTEGVNEGVILNAPVNCSPRAHCQSDT